MSDKRIIYVGDSFCLDEYHWFSHINIVKKYFSDCSIEKYSEGGASWFYSRNKFLEGTRDTFLTDRDSVKALIFFHTTAYRLNNSENIIQYQEQKKIMLSYIDYKFQDWAQEQWFREIAREYADIPTIHYNNFKSNTPEIFNLLPGMVFTTPLIHISIGELTGTDNEILAHSEKDNRANHFNEENNKIFGQHTIDAINNYTPGKFEIDILKFYRINCNAHRHPLPGFGTK